MDKYDYDYEPMFQEIKNDYASQQNIMEFLNQLDDANIKALVISKVVLGSSFDVEKSIGYKSYAASKS